MKQKNLTTTAIIIVIAIIAVIVIAAYQTKFFSEASGPTIGKLKQKLNIITETTLVPTSGPPITNVLVSIKYATNYPADSPIDIWLDKLEGILLTTFYSTEGATSYASNITIPNDTMPGNHQIIVYGIVNKSGMDYDIYNIWGFADFNVFEGLPQPQETSTTSSISATPIATVASETPSPTDTTVSTLVPTPTQTTSTESFINPIPVITAPNSSSTKNEPTTEPLYSIPTLITPAPTTSTSNPEITTIPIIVVDEKTGSTVETDKDEINANGEDKVTIGITIKDKSGNLTTETPTVEITGKDNTVSDVQKKGDGKYTVALTTTTDDEKTIKVKTKDMELPEIKIAAVNSDIDLEKAANDRIETYARWYESWWFWTLIFLGIALVLVLTLSYRHKLHTTEI